MRRLLLILASMLVFPNIALPTPVHFVTTWKTDNPGTSDSTSITIPMLRPGFDLCVDVDWNNDGVFDNSCLNGTTKPITHDYGTPGTYTVRIRGWYSTIRFDNGGDRLKIISVDQWGTKKWKTMHNAFFGASNLKVLATDTPDFSDVIEMARMFSRAKAADPDTSNWDTSAVTYMTSMFSHVTAADPDTSNWDTSAVTNMESMFYNAESANPDTSSWNTSAVTNMGAMFSHTTAADPDTSNWDTSSVIDMGTMFYNATAANPDTSNWDTSAVTSMGFMFANASAANPDTSNWDVSKLDSARNMFSGVKLSTANYERLLVNWSAQALRTEVDFDGGNSTYCSSAAVAARTRMTSTFAWNITDGGQVCDPADDFITTWKTDNPGPSNSTSITIPMVGGPYEVDWGDGAGFSEFGLHDAVSHDYGTVGTYTIRIRGTYDSISFINGGDKLKIISLDQWGTQTWRSMYGAFYGAENLEVSAVDTPDFSAVTNMHNMFGGAVKADPDTSDWDTSAVINMQAMFYNARSADPDTSNWDTSVVTNMRTMFYNAESASPDTSNWDTSAVTNMQSMFYNAESANPDTSNWNTSAVTNMAGMFSQATAADPDTSNWDTSAVTNMQVMFWNADSANPDTSNWDTSAVTNMSEMFLHAGSANPDTSNWDTSSVTNMQSMFESATSANPDTSKWNTSSLEYTEKMFANASSANPDTSAWDVSKLTFAQNMFNGTQLSTANYERLLVNWSAQDLRTEVDFHGGNSTYCSSAAVAARAHMISTYSWNITDGEQVCNPVDDFITTWKTDNDGVSNSTSVMLPFVGGPYDVDWDGNGIFDEFGLSGTVTHDYGIGNAGTYIIHLRSVYGSISFNNGGDKLKIISLDQWGTQKWTSMYGAFYGAEDLEVPAVDTPDFSAVTNMHNMFWGAVKADPDTSDWDVSGVTMMAGMFGAAAIAKPDVSNWDTSSATIMSWMFTGAYLANPDVSKWDTSKVTSMHGMFYRAFSANPDVSNWDVSSLTNAEAMFADSMLSTANYDALLENWNAQALQPSVLFNAGDTTYCSEAAAEARANIITIDGWTMIDGGNYCPPIPPDTPLTAPDMTPETDTGISDSDDFTNNNRPSFFVDCSAANNTITLYTDYPSPNTAVGSYICVSDGIEVASVSETLPAGVHNITYTDSDANGESGHSPSLAVTIDTIFSDGFEGQHLGLK